MNPLAATAATAVLALAGGAVVTILLAGCGPIPRPVAAPARAVRPERARRNRGWSLGAALVAVVVGGPLWVVAGWVAWQARAALRRHQHRARRHATTIDELPDVVDLLRLGIGAGLSMPQAVGMVARRSSGPVRVALGRARAAADAGRPLGDSLETWLSDLGDGPAGLAHVLADHLRYGTPLDPELRRFAVEARTARRHRAEQAARRVPVRLLLPLVTCVLPAFALLTVVPLLAGSLQHLLV